ncbi:unnamed protein product [marine sediment metagenome]|uniref:Uncharacterized protein n=1 Tax=marine sediment metagenome TaxID=412755 RepID=X0RRJ0_9ZZZZ
MFPAEGRNHPEPVSLANEIDGAAAEPSEKYIGLDTVPPDCCPNLGNCAEAIGTATMHSATTSAHKTPRYPVFTRALIVVP